jgi:nitroreductase
MNVREAIFSRRSVRAYTAQPVERAVLEGLLAAAVRAPSAMNAQPWAFGVIEGAERLKACSDLAKTMMLETLDAHASERYRQMLSDPDFNMFYDAPALVVIYAVEAVPDAASDCAMAALALMYAAWEQGLGTCWIGFSHPFFDSPAVKEKMGVPASARAMAQVVVGHPAAEMPVPERKAPPVLFWLDR